jgi:hypothetical protein
MGSLGWAVVLSTLSAISYAAAAVVQERLAVAGHRGLSRWAASLVLTGAGAGLHIVALGFGTVGVVQALGTLTLLFALPIAAWRTHEPIGRVAWRDAGLTVAGLVGLMALTAAPSRSAHLGPSAGRYLTLGTVVVVTVLACAARHAPSTRWRGVELAAASGVAFAVASVFSKALISSFSLGLAAVVVVLAVTGYLLGQLSYRGAGLASPLAMVSVSNPVVATIVGVVVFGEGFRFGVVGTVLAVAAGIVAATGVVGLSHRTATEVLRKSDLAVAG